MEIARVFPRKTKMTPDETDCYVGMPESYDSYVPDYNEIHISVSFTWDIPLVEKLKGAWSRYGPVKVGGPAYDDPGEEFTPGMYLKHGVTITSRGCPNNCGFCFVPKREGKIRELKIRSGNIIQDNNLLACSENHIDRVFQMLKYQKKIDFSGGFETKYITKDLCIRLSKLSIKQIWISFDNPARIKPVERAIVLLRELFDIRKVRCYVLVGFRGDTVEKARSRLQRILSIGALPFAMRYRTDAKNWKNSFIYKERKWSLLTREWSRPAIMLSDAAV